MCLLFSPTHSDTCPHTNTQTKLPMTEKHSDLWPQHKSGEITRMLEDARGCWRMLLHKWVQTIHNWTRRTNIFSSNYICPILLFSFSLFYICFWQCFILLFLFCNIFFIAKWELAYLSYSQMSTPWRSYGLRFKLELHQLQSTGQCCGQALAFLKSVNFVKKSMWI